VEKIANHPGLSQAREPILSYGAFKEWGGVAKNSCRRREVILFHFKVLSPNFLD
jgi:hypothetical protein